MIRFISRALQGALAALAIGFSSAAPAAILPQSGDNPVVFNQTLTTDNLVVLMAAAAEHPSSVATYTAEGSPYKHFWLTGFGQGSGDYLRWNIQLPTAATYRVRILYNSGGAIPFTLSDGSSSLSFTTNGIGWDKADLGVISLPAGVSALQLVKNNTDASAWIDIKSLELVRESDNAAYVNRVASFRKDTTWMSQAKYGVMFQYGPWGYPQSGSTRWTIEQGAANFNVDNFVAMVQSTGAKYVIWSITWWDFWLSSPNATVNSIMGDKSLTSTTDLVGKVAAALKAKGIRFVLYMHHGLNQEPTWAAKQNWPSSTYNLYGTGDRSTFLNNWSKVITELGNRYGSNLDGWFFDDGCVYYPAPFESLGAAARAGNPNRLIAWNPWTSARVTDFQDVWFGEGNQGESVYGSAAVGGNGIFTTGPQAGLFQQGQFTLENDWGVHDPNTPINTYSSYSTVKASADAASSKGASVSFNMMMWEGGLPSLASVGILQTLKTAYYGASTNTNLAAGKAVTASSSMESYGWYKSQLTDDNVYSVAGNMGWSSSNSTGSSHTEWVTIDLGASKKLSKVVLYPRNDGVNRGYGFPIDYTIAVSNDNVSWTTVVTQTGAANPGDTDPAFTLGSVSARYVRVNATKLRANPNDANQYRLQFAEIRVY